MLETKNLSGKCADLNALFVGLARAAGMPARDLYGLRVAPSEQFPSLGRAGGDVTTAQHCRAEVWVTNIGWIPVDPADVRKVILEEKPGASLDDPYIAKVRDDAVRIVGDELDRLSTMRMTCRCPARPASRCRS